MLRKGCLAGYLMVGLVGLAVAVEAAVLEPVLRARDLTGAVMVQRPGKSDAVPVEDGMTYPYGSRFRSEADSAVTLVMVDDSVVRVLANTEIVFTENDRDRKIKTVQLLAGEVEANLGDGFQEGGNVLNIQAANALAQAVGTRYRVASRYEQDLQIVIIRVLAGIVRVFGENFQILELGADQWISLLSPADASFLRLKNLRGDYDVVIKDEDKGDRSLATEEGSVLKIWQRVVPETGERVVTAVFTDPEGQMQEQISVTFAPGEYADFLDDIQGADDASPWPGMGQQSGQQSGQQPGPPADGENPTPPDDFMDKLVERTLGELMPGVGTTPPRPRPPRPPQRPTPTPVGNR